MKNILIVEDDKAFNKLLSEYLTSVGHSVISAFDGVEAQKLCQHEEPKLIITDVIMPEEDGIGLMIKMKKQYRCKIIVYSGGGSINAEDYLEVAQQLGADKVFKKPFALEDLAKAVEVLTA